MRRWKRRKSRTASNLEEARDGLSMSEGEEGLQLPLLVGRPADEGVVVDLVGVGQERGRERRLLHLEPAGHARDDLPLPRVDRPVGLVVIVAEQALEAERGARVQPDRPAAGTDRGGAREPAGLVVGPEVVEAEVEIAALEGRGGYEAVARTVRDR